jgi:hypothetical protein
MRAFFNVLGIIAATLLSFVLIAVLITAPVWQGFSGLLKSDVLEKMVTKMDFAEVVTSSPELMAELTSEGISPEAAEAILNSNTFDELLQILSADFLLAAKGEFTTTALTGDKLVEIADRNRSEIVSIVRLLTPEASLLTDPQLEQLVDSMLPIFSGSIVAEVDGMLLELQTDLAQEGITQALEIAASPIITLALLGVAFVLALLIFLFRLRHAEGFLWLGIDSILAALPVLGIGALLKSTGILNAATAQVPDAEMASVLFPVLGAVGSTILMGGAVLIGLGIVLIAAFVLLRDRRMRKARQATPPSLGEVM